MFCCFSRSRGFKRVPSNSETQSLLKQAKIKHRDSFSSSSLSYNSFKKVDTSDTTKSYLENSSSQRTETLISHWFHLLEKGGRKLKDAFISGWNTLDASFKTFFTNFMKFFSKTQKKEILPSSSEGAESLGAFPIPTLPQGFQTVPETFLEELKKLYETEMDERLSRDKEKENGRDLLNKAHEETLEKIVSKTLAEFPPKIQQESEKSLKVLQMEEKELKAQLKLFLVKKLDLERSLKSISNIERLKSYSFVESLSRQKTSELSDQPKSQEIENLENAARLYIKGNPERGQKSYLDWDNLEKKFKENYAYKRLYESRRHEEAFTCTLEESLKEVYKNKFSHHDVESTTGLCIAKVLNEEMKERFEATGFMQKAYLDDRRDVVCSFPQIKQCRTIDELLEKMEAQDNPALSFHLKSLSQEEKKQLAQMLLEKKIQKRG